jgi:hypothetical protein
MVAVCSEASLYISGAKVSSYWSFIPTGHLSSNWPNSGQGDQAQCTWGDISSGCRPPVPASYYPRYVTLGLQYHYGTRYKSYSSDSSAEFAKWRYIRGWLFLYTLLFHLFNSSSMYSIAPSFCSLWVTAYVTGE